jgi:hypothetical protein
MVLVRRSVLGLEQFVRNEAADVSSYAFHIREDSVDQYENHIDYRWSLTSTA